MFTLKTEFLKHIEKKEILTVDFWSPALNRLDLNVNYTEKEYKRFLALLDTIDITDKQACYSVNMTVYYKDGSHSTWDTYFVYYPAQN